MNSKKAKQLRKQANFDVNAERQYKGSVPEFMPVTDPSTGMVIDIKKVKFGVPFTCVNVERQEYQKLKKEV